MFTEEPSRLCSSFVLVRCTRKAALFQFGHRFRVGIFNGSLELSVLLVSLVLIIIAGAGQGESSLVKDFFSPVDAQQYSLRMSMGSLPTPIGTASDRVIRASPDIVYRTAQNYLKHNDIIVEF